MTAEDGVLRGRGEIARDGGAGRTGQKAGGVGTDIRILAAREHTGHEALQIFLLLRGEGSRHG